MAEQMSNAVSSGQTHRWRNFSTLVSWGCFCQPSSLCGPRKSNKLKGTLSQKSTKHGRNTVGVPKPAFVLQKNKVLIAYCPQNKGAGRYSCSNCQPEVTMTCSESGFRDVQICVMRILLWFLFVALMFLKGKKGSEGRIVLDGRSLSKTCRVLQWRDMCTKRHRNNRFLEIKHCLYTTRR